AWAAALAASLAPEPPAAAAHPGDPDPSFGTGGAKRFPLDPGVHDWEGQSVAVQKDGKIVVATPYVRDGTDQNLLVWRFLPNGDPDPAFSVAGAAVLAISGDQTAHAVALQKDGRIVVAGEALVDPDPLHLAYHMIGARFTTDGTLDTSFHGVGFTDFDFGPGTSAHAFAMALQKDGKIVLAGTAVGQSSADFGVARLTADGNLDPTFGSGGHVRTPIEGSASAQAVAIQKDGRIVLAGDTIPPVANLHFALARYLPDGNRDRS